MTTSAKSTPSSSPAHETWVTKEGDQLAFDGVYYSYRTADGLRAFKLWTPPQDEPIKGLLLFGNPGGGLGGDTRDKSRQQDMLEFAGRHGLAVAGVTGFPGRETYDDLGKYILRGLTAMGEHGVHPELAHVPFIATGGSNAGSFSYGMMCLAPERTIAITPNVGGYHDVDAPAEAHKVPAWIHIGALDELSTSGVERTEELFRVNAAQGEIFWTWDAEMKGHENGGADHVDMAFWHDVLAARLPEEFTPGEPVPLQPLDHDSGWMADLRSWDHRITRVFPANELPEDAEPGRYGWILNEPIARLYQANATRSRPIFVELADAEQSEQGGTSGVYLSAGLSNIVDPGEEVRLRVRKKPLAFGINKVDLYDRGELLGSVDLREEDTLTITVDGDQPLYALYAHAIDERGQAERISAPLQLLVRDPEVSQRISDQLAPLGLAARAKDTAVAPQAPSQSLPGAPYPTDVFASAALSNDADLQGEGAVAKALMSEAPALKIGTRYAIQPPTDPAGTNVIARSGWNEKGLYLLFEVEDRTWSKPGEQYADTLDFHIASVDPSRVLATEKPDIAVYAKPGDTHLLSSALQIQIPIGTLAPKPTTMVNFWDPWDMRSETWTADDEFGGTGFDVNLVDMAPDRRAVEVFIPWHLVGNPGFSSAPDAGTRLTCMIGYRDGEPDHKLAWPTGLDPWFGTPLDGGPSPFGQIVLMPAEEDAR